MKPSCLPVYLLMRLYTIGHYSAHLIPPCRFCFRTGLSTGLSENQVSQTPIVYILHTIIVPTEMCILGYTASFLNIYIYIYVCVCGPVSRVHIHIHTVHMCTYTYYIRIHTHVHIDIGRRLGVPRKPIAISLYGSAKC